MYICSIGLAVTVIVDNSCLGCGVLYEIVTFLTWLLLKLRNFCLNDEEISGKSEKFLYEC